MHILKENEPVKPFALFNLGFRPFFLFAGIFSVFSMSVWMAIYVMQAQGILSVKLSPMLWHGHEMVFGYATAVAAGFLLTAVRNWTNVQTVNGVGLAMLVSLWLIARVAPFIQSDLSLIVMAVADLLFMTYLSFELIKPIVRVKQWKQLAVVLKIVLLMCSNALFYLGLLKILPPEAMSWGLYSGFYMIISLILLMGRRVIPFFIEKGVDEDVTLNNWKWLDLSSLFLFLAFVIAEVFFNYPLIPEALAALLFALHSLRLWGWYTKGIWGKPLLWVLYIGYGFIVAGFGLKALTTVFGLSPWLALHAFAVGGIGMITLGMMSRVALGHTGRNVFDPPKTLSIVFMLIAIAAIMRVFFVMIFPTAYYLWVIAASQVFWLAAFAIFSIIYVPMLIKPRVDGTFG